MDELKIEGHELSAWIAHFDIPSEGFAFLKADPKDDANTARIKKMAYTKVQSCRVKSSNMLHRLGLPASNSVLLIPNTVSERSIDETILTVEKEYKSVNDILKDLGLQSVGEPYIRKVAIVKFQFTAFRDMAERQLMERIDQTLNTLAKKINELVNMDDAKKRSAKSRYNSELKEIDEMRDLAKKLSIEGEDKFNLLESMYRKALSVVG